MRNTLRIEYIRKSQGQKQKEMWSADNLQDIVDERWSATVRSIRICTAFSICHAQW